MLNVEQMGWVPYLKHPNDLQGAFCSQQLRQINLPARHGWAPVTDTGFRIWVVCNILKIPNNKNH